MNQSRAQSQSPLMGTRRLSTLSSHGHQLILGTRLRLIQVKRFSPSSCLRSLLMRIKQIPCLNITWIQPIPLGPNLSPLVHRLYHHGSVSLCKFPAPGLQIVNILSVRFLLLWALLLKFLPSAFLLGNLLPRIVLIEVLIMSGRQEAMLEAMQREVPTRATLARNMQPSLICLLAI